MPKERRTVSVVRNDYQPSKAEMEEPINLRLPDGKRPTMEQLADALLTPVKVTVKERP